MPDIQKNLHHIKQLIASYEQKYGRKAESVRLLVASKGRSVEEMKEVVRAGHTVFGENFVQDALTKMLSFPDDLAIEWHIIGHIQRNKTRKTAEHFDWVETIDHPVIAQRLNDQRPPHLSPLNICIEVNVSGEATKSGVLMEDALALAKYCARLPWLKLRGLMTVPAPNDDFQQQRRGFRTLYELFERFRSEGFEVDVLSMGMSNDFEAAIAEGATEVRIGSAIFDQ